MNKLNLNWKLLGYTTHSDRIFEAKLCQFKVVAIQSFYKPQSFTCEILINGTPYKVHDKQVPKVISNGVIQDLRCLINW